MGRMSEMHRERQEQEARVEAERLDAKAPAWLDECYRKVNGVKMARIACGIARYDDEELESTWPEGGPMTSTEDFTPASEGF